MALQATAKAKFDETLELAINLGTNPKKGEQAVRGTAVLPHGTGKSVRVAAFAEGEDAVAATAAGETCCVCAQLSAVTQSWTQGLESACHWCEAFSVLSEVVSPLG